MTTLLTASAFVVAVGSGVVVIAFAALVERLWGSKLGFGAVVVVGGIAGLAATGYLPASLVVAVALMAGGSAIAPGHRGWSYAAVIPGAAALVWAAGSPVPMWARVMAGIGTIVATPRVVATDEAVPRWIGLAFAVSALGVYATVPDTESATALVGAAVAAACYGAVIQVVSDHAGLGRAGAGAATGLLVWSTLDGGRARPGAVVGGLACLGLLVFPRLWLQRRSPAALALTGVAHFVDVAIASRVAGLERSGVVAGLIVVPTLYAIALSTAAVHRRIRDHSGESPIRHVERLE